METCSSRVPPLRVPACAVLTLVRRSRGGCPPHPDPLPRRGEGNGLGPLRLGNDRLACYGFVGASITSPHPSPTATTVFVTGCFDSVSPVFHSSERKTSFSGLWRDIAGGSCVGDPVLPRPLPYFIQLFLLRLKRLCAQPRVDAAILRVRGARLTPLGC